MSKTDRTSAAAEVIDEAYEHWVSNTDDQGNPVTGLGESISTALDEKGLLSHPLPEPDENGLWKTGVSTHGDVTVTPHGEVHLGATNVTQRHLFLSEDKAFRLAVVLLAALKKIGDDKHGKHRQS